MNSHFSLMYLLLYVSCVCKKATKKPERKKEKVFKYKDADGDENVGKNVLRIKKNDTY